MSTSNTTRRVRELAAVLTLSARSTTTATASRSLGADPSNSSSSTILDPTSAVLNRSFHQTPRDVSASVPTTTTDSNSLRSHQVLSHSETATTTTTVGQKRLIQPPAPPLLMLTGDEFQVSQDGISRSFYRLDPFVHREHDDVTSRLSNTAGVALEEIYDLPYNRKQFILRQDTAMDGADVESSSSLFTHARRNKKKKPKTGSFQQQLGEDTDNERAPIGCALADPVNVQEIERHLHYMDSQDHSGGTTWESSIAMALYCCAHPDILRGDVIELGSGVGMGGILSSVGPASVSRNGSNNHHLRSMTLTDGSDEALEICERNLRHVEGGNRPFFPLRACKLDWNDVVAKSKTRNDDDSTHGKKYETVLACDCAYRYENVPILCESMKALLDTESENARIHIFGPYNRGAYHQLIEYLRDDLKLGVQLEWIEMHRYRMKSNSNHPMYNQRARSTPDEYASLATAKFIHATASLQNNIGTMGSRCSTNMSDLD